MSVKSLLKKNRLIYKAASALQKLPYPLLTASCGLYHRLFGVDGRAVFFCCFDGMLYNDNPRAVAEALHAIRPDARLLFCLSKKGMRDADIPDYIIRVRRFTPRALKAMATARVLVKNAAMRPWMRKYPDQFYVQTWHGDRGFKKVLLDAHPDTPSYRREGEWIDLAISGSDFGTGVYHSAMAFRGEVLSCGYPRNDLLLRNPPEEALRVRKALGIPEGCRVLLYAPTFRNARSGAAQSATLSLEKVRQVLERVSGERWICITRGHELISGIRSDAWKDVSDWRETSELLLACDMLITDYSSIGGDFMLLNRPVIYYQPDAEKYKNERSFYFDPDRSPLIVAHTEAELLDILSRPIDAPANCKAVLDFFGAHETGHASETVAERIADMLE